MKKVVVISTSLRPGSNSHALAGFLDVVSLLLNVKDIL